MANEIQREDRGNITILLVPARLDTLLGGLLSERCKELVKEGRFRVVVDCKDLKFISSTSIVTLLTFHQQAVAKGGDLKFANVSERIEDIFRLAKLERIFSWYLSVDEAISTF